MGTIIIDEEFKKLLNATQRYHI